MRKLLQVENYIMLPKSKKPTAAHLRPKALTDSSYTIFIALIKNRVEKHFNYATITGWMRTIQNKIQGQFKDISRTLKKNSRT